MVVNQWRPWRKWVIMGFNSIISSKVIRKWKDENAGWNFESSQTITVMSIYKNVKAACSCLNSHAHAYRPCWSTDSQGHSVIMLFVKVSHDSSQCWQMAVCHVCWLMTDWLHNAKYRDDASCITMEWGHEKRNAGLIYQWYDYNNITIW